jgi:RecB family exonuclease
LRREPERCHWVFPTARLRRAALRDWLGERRQQAAILPGLHTLETFAGWVLEHSLSQRPSITAAERLFRITRAWHEASGRPIGPGLLGQLDRFVRDWQACGLVPRDDAPDPIERTVAGYLRDLDREQRSDRMSRIEAVAKEVSDPESYASRLLFHEPASVLFDGFHRLEPIELQLIATLSHRCDVLLWLVGVPGQKGAKVVERALGTLREQGCRLDVHDVPDQPRQIAALGRRLFPVGIERAEQSESPSGLYLLKPRDAVAELEAIATCIKADFRTEAVSNRPLRISDVAVVIPGPAYDPLVREVFPRHGLEFNLAGQALGLSSSRPARLLHAAVELIRGEWRHALLLDFLQQPMVLRKLSHSHLLHDLIAQRPRARQRLQFAVWTSAWQRQLQTLRDRLERWEAGTLPLPEETSLERESFLARHLEQLEALEQLVESLQVILRPVAKLEQALGDVAPTKPLAALVTACVEILQSVEIEQWLSPHSVPHHPEQPAVPWVELEKDQQSYFKLLALLSELAVQPSEQLPLSSEGRPDLLAAFVLALDNDSYQIKTEDDAGVQLFELREIRGLRFRHVYVLGLIDGQVPAVPEEGVLAARRRQSERLRQHLEDKEAEAQHLFAQVFEAAEEKLVLSQPRRSGEEKTLPSPFLTAVLDRVSTPALAIPALVCGGAGLGQFFGRQSRWESQPITEALGSAHESAIAVFHKDLTAWKSRPGWPEAIRVDTPALLRALFPDERPFSPSSLEAYAACPFRYFGQHVLRLSERDGDEARLLYGSLVHRVFQRFYEELRQSLGVAAGEPLPPVADHHEARLRELFEVEWRSQEEGSMPPEFESLFTHANGVLRLFFDAIQPLEREHGNLLNEYVLGTKEHGIVIGVDGAGRPVAIRGKIDRVDKQRGRKHKVVITDYKTGLPPELPKLHEKLDDGRLLQLPLYGATLQTTDGELEVVGGIYLHLNANARREAMRPDRMLIQLGESGSDGATGKRTPLDIEAARQKALLFAGQIRHGVFNLSQHSTGPTCECTTRCSLRHACRQPEGYQTD